MSESTVRCWLVERTFDDRNLVTIVYATPDGSRYQRRERSATALRTGSEVTAAADVPESELEAAPDEATRERYAAEAERIAERYEPGDSL